MFEADGAGTPYRQFATLGGGSRRSATARQRVGWGYAFRSEDLPLDSRGQMRVKFELAGAGEVWIDNVQLYDLLFPLKFYEHSRAGEAGVGETDSRGRQRAGRRPSCRIACVCSRAIGRGS